MTTIVTLAFWIAVGTAWGCSGHIYYCGVNQKQVNVNTVLTLIIVSVLAMAIASIGNTITQGAYLSAIKAWK